MSNIRSRFWAGSPAIKSKLLPVAGVLLMMSFGRLLVASPAPSPLLQTPANNVQNADPDGVLSWRWIDDLMVNGSFETGMSPGWYTDTVSPAQPWTVYTDTTNANGMGFRFAEASFAYPVSMGQLIQDIYIPPDAISATLQWKERFLQSTPYPTQYGRFRFYLYQGGVPVMTLEDVYGNEPVFRTHTFVARTTNLLAFAGQNIQLVLQANSYSAVAIHAWYLDLDGFSFSSEHFSTPEFQVLLGKTSTLRSTNQIGSTTALSFSLPPLEPATTYYWRIGAVRDGVTNNSSTFHFRTGPRVLPSLVVKALTPAGVNLAFSTKTNRNYAIEQTDQLGASASWYDVFDAGQGTGSEMEVEIPWPGNDQAFWRLRAAP